MTPTRGRPRIFDEEKALDKVLKLFWQRGYPCTSYTDLCRATGLNKPSLYAAFGNKEAMFLAALELYQSHHLTPMLGALTLEPDGHQALHKLLIATVNHLTIETHPQGCMIAINSAYSAAPEMPLAIIKALVEITETTRKAITHRLNRALEENQLPPSTDISAFTYFYEALISGLSALAKNGTSRDDLMKIVDCALLIWPTACHPKVGTGFGINDSLQ